MKKQESIKQDLINTSLSFQEIANKYDVAKQTIYNINSGKTHKEDGLDYPLRQTKSSSSLTKEELSFLKENKDKYNIKQLHLIIGKYTWQNISNIVSTDLSTIESIEIGEQLKLRQEVFDFIATPRLELIHSLDSELDKEDSIYIKFLARFGVPIEKVILNYKEIILFHNPELDYPIETCEDVKRYLDWGGTASRVIWYINQVYRNHLSKYKGEQFFWDDFNIELFSSLIDEVTWKKYRPVIESMIQFNTRERFAKRR